MFRHLPSLLLMLVLVASPAAARSRVEIAQAGGYPELRVDGKPFFIYGVEFPYSSFPPADRSSILADFKSLGINTVRLEVRREWHETRQGSFDFSGRTRPERDLLGVLRQLAALRLEASLALTLDPRAPDPRSWVRALA
ncbi:MAG: beta-galactosidase, partial [Acidobacteria bacterium]|nr:beta-galactosidase [Acidobacteriota bacterium]